MKKTLRSILAGALALLAVSCYDDSALRTEIGKLGDRVTAIEESLSSEIERINSLFEKVQTLEDKVGAVKVETTDGVTKLTLTNGDEIVLSKNGAITIVDGGWATVATDGTVTPLGVKVGHELNFKVEGDELMVSYDGTTYVATGVKVSEYTAHVIGNVVPAEDGKSVAVTIGDQTINLSIYATATFELSRSSFYVGYGFSKSFTVTTDGEDFYVASKPDGWKVAVDGKTVTVTAPSQALVELGVVEVEGEIVLHADAEVCTYARLQVEAGPAFSVEVDTNTGMVTFFNAISIEYPDQTGMGEPTYDFGDALVGILPVSDFAFFSSVDELIEASEYMAIPSGYLANIKANNELGGMYEAGVYEEDSFQISIADLGNSFWPSINIEEGMHYVVWAIPQTTEVLKDLYTVAMYKPIKINLEAKTKTFSEITLDLTCSGATSYHVGAYPASMFEYMSFEEFMMTGYMGVGPWKQFQMYGEPEILGTAVESGSTISVAELNMGALAPNTEYLVYVFPYDETKDSADYDFAADMAPYVYTFTTEGLVAGAPEATVVKDEATTTYTTIGVKLTPAEGTEVYYYFTDAGAWDEYTDDQIVAAVMDYCYSPKTAAATLKDSYLTPGDKRQIYAVAVTEDGKYSIVTYVFETLPLPYSPAISMTFESATKDETTGEYTVVFNVTGATKVAAYCYYTSSTPSSFATNIMSYGFASSYTSYKWAEVVDGKATIVVKPGSASYDYLFYSAYNVGTSAVEDLSEPAYIQLSTSL